MPTPHINFNDEELCESTKVLADQFRCIKCNSIPFRCQQCTQCESIYCYKCVIDLQTSPLCHKDAPFKKIHRKLLQVFQETIKFKHVCNLSSHDSDDEDIEESSLKRQKLEEEDNQNEQSSQTCVSASQTHQSSFKDKNINKELPRDQSAQIRSSENEISESNSIIIDKISHQNSISSTIQTPKEHSLNPCE